MKRFTVALFFVMLLTQAATALAQSSSVAERIERIMNRSRLSYEGMK